MPTWTANVAERRAFFLWCPAARASLQNCPPSPSRARPARPAPAQRAIATILCVQRFRQKNSAPLSASVFKTNPGSEENSFWGGAASSSQLREFSRTNNVIGLERNGGNARVFDFVAEKKVTPAQVALAWLLAQKPWIVPIHGTTKLHRLSENCGAAAVQLAPEDLRALENAAAKIQVQGGVTRTLAKTGRAVSRIKYGNQCGRMLASFSST